VTDYDEMGKKTAFRRHSKWLPLSPEVKDAIERDDEAVDVGGWTELLAGEGDEPRRLTARDAIMSQPSFAPSDAPPLEAGAVEEEPAQ
jgi:recombinational DNA repair protein RecT